MYYRTIVAFKPLASILAGLFVGLTLCGCPAPSAEFSASPTEGDAPLTVRFSDLSESTAGAVESWLWDFGDGTSSTDKNPTHVYATQGSYRVALTVSSAFGSGSETKNAYITVRSAPVAAFSATPRTGTTPLAVQFLDESDGGPFAITAREWSFGDGETSEEEDPRHTYVQPGAYTVALKVTSEGGTDTETREAYIQVGALPTASFRAAPATGEAPLDVQFTDMSTPGGSPIESWKWSFGDGETSAEQNPAHRYEAPGVYTVALTVRNASGEVTSTRANFIRTTAPPVAAFRASPVQGAAPLSTTFTDESAPGTSPITGWLWDFGDGTSSAERNPTHQFTAAGHYDISLTVETDAGTDTLLKEKFITALAPPQAGFSASPLRGAAPLSVDFKDTSVAGASAITTRQWSFGDASFSGETNPVHVYTAPGIYPVSLSVQSSVGSSTLNREAYIEVVALPVAAFEASATSGESPFSVTFADTSSPGTQPITTWRWDLGDGATSDEQNPAHEYTGTGEYTVKLTVTTAEGADTATRSQYIRVFERADADFTGEPTTGTAPLSVQFRDASDPGSVGIASRSWDFGDGNTSGLEDPLHVYDKPGTYTVSLILGTPSGPDSEQKSNFIRVEPRVAFARTPASGTAPLTVNFTDTTVASPLTVGAWAWDFGDGGTSAAQHPSHAYTVAGTYDVRLTVTTEQGDVSTVQAGSVVVRPQPAFSGTPRSATGAPLSVEFVDETDPGTVTLGSWDWNFGDGSHSTVQNPTHAFAKPGVYDVSLTVATPLGNSTTVKEDYIVIRPAAAFTATPTTGAGSLAVQFTDTTDPGLLSINTWDWDFGDGNTSRVRNPLHTYAQPGTYSVTLTTASTQGVDSETKTDLIVVKPVVSFSGNVTSGPAPLAVTFSDETNTGLLETEAWAWNFGQGDPSDEESPVYTYAEAGLYDVSLMITTAQGDVSGKREDYIEVLPVIAVATVVTPGSGTSSVAFTNTTDTGGLTGVAWLWTFGDGETSTAVSPTHVFAEPGIYTVTLALTSNEGVGVTETITTVNVDPVVSLSANPMDGVAPLDVQFTDTSETGSLAVSAVLWDFGDGETSTEANPLHTYAAAGTFNATLRITTPLGQHTSPAPVTIEVAPEPNFSGIPRSGTVPLSVVFSNTSDIGGATITGTDWDFGDGATSTAATPTHSYTVPGLYTVNFVLTTTGGVENTTKTDYIRANPLPAFTPDVTSGGVPLSVDFTNTTVLGSVVPTAYLWDFGDGATSADENPTHNYTAPGVYSVRLTITSIQGQSSTIETDLITVAPDVLFSASTSGGAAPLGVTFTATTAVGNLTVTDWIWDFGDGSTPETTASGSVLYTYTTPGTYTPTLTLVTDGGNFSGPLATDIEVNPVPAFSANLQSGPGVLTATFSDDTDTGNVSTSSRTWNWGDGTANTTTNNATANHTFTAPGTYDVTLTINTATQGSHSTTETDFITVHPLSFTINGGLTGSTPHNISVTNTTPAGDLAITGTQWDYGDGTGQTASTSHSYTTPGTYLISMVVTTSQGSRTFTTTTPVVVSPVITHSADVTAGPAVVDVTFTDNTNIGGVSVTSRTWNFGDGTSETVLAPTTTASHRYTNSGATALVRSATVTLNTSIGNFLSASPVTITIHPINFSGDTSNQDAPLLVTFTDLTSTGGLTIPSRTWNFRDGGANAATTGNTVTRNFTKAGSYDVELTITTSQGNTATASLVTPVLVRPVLKYLVSGSATGPAPFTANFQDATDTGNLTGLSRRWTWGDGKSDTVAGTTTSHEFKAAGCYEVTMELISNEGTFTDDGQAISISADEVRSLSGFTNPNFFQTGIMFDVQASRALQINSYTLSFIASGISSDMRLYRHSASSFGAEGSSTNWTNLGTINVTSGTNVLLDFQDFPLATNARRGLYVLNRSAGAGSPDIRNVVGAANTFVTDGNLMLFTNCGKSFGGNNDFGGATSFFRWFVGRVNYSYAVVCNKQNGGLERDTKNVVWNVGEENAGPETRITIENETEAVQASDGGWAAIGYHSAFGPTSESPLLIRTDTDMELLWELDLGKFAFDAVSGVVALTDGDLLVWGETGLDGMPGKLMLLRLDASGATRWIQVVSGSLATDAVSFVPVSGGDLLVLTGQTLDDGSELPVLNRIDAFSNVLWSTSLESVPNRDDWGVFERADGLTTVYGSISDVVDHGALWESHLDEDGFVVDMTPVP